MSMPKRTPEDAALHRHVGARLRAARREAGLTQGAVAQRLGVSFQQVQKYERGQDSVPAARLDAAAALLGKPVGWFSAERPDCESAMDLDAVEAA